MAQRKKTTTKTQRAPGTTAQARSDNLEALREILLGQERRSVSERTQQIEHDLTREIRAIRDELRSRGLRLDKELAAAHRRHKSLVTRVARLTESVDESLAAMRKRADEQMRDLAAGVDAVLADWGRSHIDRAALSTLLQGLAKRLAAGPARKRKPATS